MLPGPNLLGPEILFLSFSYHFILFSLLFKDISLKFMELYMMLIIIFLSLLKYLHINGAVLGSV